MVDVHTKEQRSYNMSRIMGKNTKPELKLKAFFEKKNFIYQSNEYGKPDFIHYRRKIVVFIDGCFWHGCPSHCRMPSSNINYWNNKIEKNKIRDKKITKTMKMRGWQVIRIWEHEIKTGKLNRKLRQIKIAQQNISADGE